MPRRSEVEDGALAKAAGAESSKDALRRVRNRLSQRAIRERRAIRIQQLEQELAQTRQNDSETRFDDLRAENDKLRNGLHATRKKLLSISTTTSSVADTIRILLNLNLAKENPEDEPDPVALGPPKDERTGAITSPQESPSTEEIVMEQQNGLRDLFPEQFDPVLDLEDLVMNNASFSSLTSRKQQLGTDIWGTPEAWNDESFMDQISRHASTTRLLMEKAAIKAVPSLDEILPTTGTLTLSPRRAVSNFSEHLEHIFKLLRLSGIDEQFSSAPLLVHSMLHCFIQQCWPVMDHWFQVTNSCTFMKTVMWWQTTKSHQSFLDMPGGYTPTPSQLVLSYPCIIDWIPHPTIRNVMVTNYESYDVDQVICDMTDAYVVEDGNGLQDANLEPLNVMEIVQRYNSPSEDTRMVHPYANATASHLHPQSQFLQMHRIYRFKIDPSFFVKYPGLYDATAIAKTGCNSIRIHERLEINHRPLPFSTANANAYLDVITQAKSNGFR